MHTNKGTGSSKYPSLASFEYELPSALSQLLLQRAGFLILNLQIIHDLRHVRHPSCRFLGARTLVFRVDFSGWAVRSEPAVSVAPADSIGLWVSAP